MSTIEHTLITDLLTQPSISPDDHGCQTYIADILKELGFNIQPMNYGDVSNLWAKRGKTGPLLVFAGHTDVVPPGPLDQWRFNPFQPTQHDDRLFARGAADMKVALACMVLACRDFINDHPQHHGSIGFLITSCEEETTADGTKRVIDTLYRNQEKIDWCIVGEASSQQQLGDQIKVGRRGSLCGELTIIGKQGHIAYPHTATNPIHIALNALSELTQTEWDQGNEFFAPTSLQFSNINAGTGASNVIPAEMKVSFNFRFSPAVTAEQLKQRMSDILKKHDVKHQLDWFPSGNPFLSKEGDLIKATKAAIKDVTNLDTHCDTSGGTSDARFIAPHGIETIELGFCNESIHQINENIEIKHIALLKDIYYHILVKLLT